MRETLSKPKADQLARKAGIDPAVVKHVWHRGDRKSVLIVLHDGSAYELPKGGNAETVARVS